MAEWKRTLNDAVTEWHRDRGADMPDLNELASAGLDLEFFQGFPNFFVLPMYSSASSYRFRPLGPEETLMEIWSLTRDATGEERERPTPPEAWAHDDPRWPPIPAQDFSNMPRQQLGLHAHGLRVHAPVRRSSRATSPTSSAPSTATSPGSPTTSCSRRSVRSTCIHSTGRSSTSGSERIDRASSAESFQEAARMSTTSTFADVAEGVRAALAAYTQALDDGRTDDVVATFCSDGGCDIPGMGTHEGHDALRAAYSKWKPRRPQRHLVLNTLVTDWNDDEATAISDVVFILLGDDGWTIQLVGRYHDTLHTRRGLALPPPGRRVRDLTRRFVTRLRGQNPTGASQSGQSGRSRGRWPSRIRSAPSWWVSVRASPNSTSRTMVRRTNRWRSCSVVKPMPASTC